MKVVAVTTVKGGEGKSTFVILVANHLASKGKRVLVVDMDPQNSTSFWFLPPDADDKKNIATAIFSADLANNIIPISSNIHICQSNLALWNLRAMPTSGFKNLLDTVSKDYDYCIIDTAPTFDNIVLMAVRSADLCILPAKLKDTFSLKTLSFYRNQLIREGLSSVVSSLAVVYNHYRSDAEGIQFEKAYENTHDLFFVSKLSTTAQVKDAIIYKSPVSNLKKWNILFPFLDSITNEIESFFSASMGE